MDDIDPAARLLVAVVTRLRDLAAARDEGWYRIPLTRAPRALHAEYLAFYQTAVFGAERWAVRYLAEVRTVNIVTRAALLPEEAGHPRASERYYRFAIGPLLALPAPLPSRRLRRIAFIPTTCWPAAARPRSDRAVASRRGCRFRLPASGFRLVTPFQQALSKRAAVWREQGGGGADVGAQLGVHIRHETGGARLIQRPAVVVEKLTGHDVSGPPRTDRRRCGKPSHVVGHAADRRHGHH